MGFLDTIKATFGKKDVSVLGIDIGASAIKVVQIKRKKGRAVLETYGELALGPYAGTEVGRATNLTAERNAEALSDILREANTTTVQCGISLPITSSLITFISVPQVGDKQFADVVSLEARKYIPVPMTEVVLDWSVVPKDNVLETDQNSESSVQQGSVANNTSPAGFGSSSQIKSQPAKEMTDVLVVAIHNEAISSYQRVCTLSKLNPSFFEIELFSTIRAVVEQGIQAHMIMDMGARTTKLYIVERGLLRSSHVVNRGSQDITLALSRALNISIDEAEQIKRGYGLQGGVEHKDVAEIISLTLDYIFYESNRVLLNYQKQTNKNIASVVLTGGGVLLKGLAELAQASFQTQVMYADPFSKLETPAFLADQFKMAGPEFAVAIGLALRRLSEVQ